MLTSAIPTQAQPAALSFLPAVAAGDVALLNALHRHRRRIDAVVAGRKVTIETVARTIIAPSDYAFRLTLSGQRALFRVTANLVDACAQSLGVVRLDRLGSRQAGMVLELALLELIKALEAGLRADIRFEERIDAIESDATLLPLRLRVGGIAGGDGDIELFVDRQSTAAIAAALDHFAVPNRRIDRLPIPVSICRGGTELTLAELRSLRPGDVIVADCDPRQGNAAVAVVGGRIPFATEPVATGYRLVSKITASRTDSGEWFMQQPTDALQRPSSDEAGLEQLPTRIVFEIGRLEMPLADVRHLAPGYVLPLAKSVESAVDIVANGRKIGHGSLLKIGDSIGVRVERLLSDD